MGSYNYRYDLNLIVFIHLSVLNYEILVLLHFCRCSFEYIRVLRDTYFDELDFVVVAVEDGDVRTVVCDGSMSGEFRVP